MLLRKSCEKKRKAFFNHPPYTIAIVNLALIYSMLIISWSFCKTHFFHKLITDTVLSKLQIIIKQFQNREDGYCEQFKKVVIWFEITCCGLGVGCYRVANLASHRITWIRLVSKITSHKFYEYTKSRQLTYKKDESAIDSELRAIFYVPHKTEESSCVSRDESVLSK